MSAVSSDTIRRGQNIENANIIAFPVKSGETIYSGSIVVVGEDGYLYDLDATSKLEGRLAAIVADETNNVTGAAATTSSGSISSVGRKSVPAGDKTVRECYVSGIFEFASSGLTQADVGKTVYATDNNTVSVTPNGVAVGTLVRYESATLCYVELNKFYSASGDIIITGSLTAATDTTAGAVLTFQNNLGFTCLVTGMYLNITTKSTGAATIDVGIATTVASNDALLDGTNAETVKLHSIVVDKGTNGGERLLAANSYITATASATTEGMVGTYIIILKRVA